jgi:hypothetical protein
MAKAICFLYGFIIFVSAFCFGAKEMRSIKNDIFLYDQYAQYKKEVTGPNIQNGIDRDLNQTNKYNA